MYRALLAAGLVLAASQASAISYTVATAVITDATFETDPGSLPSEVAGNPDGFLSHKLRGTIDADLMLDPLLADPSVPFFFEFLADVSIDGVRVLDGALGPVGPATFGEISASPLYAGFFDLIAALEADPVGYGSGSTPPIPIPGGPTIPPISASVEWDVDDIVLTPTTIDGEFYFGVSEDLSLPVLTLLALIGIDPPASGLAPSYDIAAEFAIRAAPVATPIPLPAPAFLLIGGLAAIGALGARRARR